MADKNSILIKIVCNPCETVGPSTENEILPVEIHTNEALAICVHPDGIPMAMTIEHCLEVYDWFESSEVVEPVPGITDVYMTYDRNKVIRNNGHEWLPDAIIAYRVDEQDNVISLSKEDMYRICSNMKLLSRVINNSATNERKIAFALR